MKQRRWFAALSCLIATCAARAARAEDLFEIQVFHARIDPYQHPALEIHSNFVALGATRTVPPEAPTRHVLYEMLEPTYGIAPEWEIGMHVQQAFRADGTFDWGGTKLRTMVLFTPADVPHAWRFALNLEGGYQPARFDAARWGAELRPVIEWTEGALDLDINPVLAVPFGGDRPGVPALQPAVSGRARVGAILPSLEYYAELGPVSALSSFNEKRHYLFETVDLVGWDRWILHAGLGEGPCPDPLAAT